MRQPEIAAVGFVFGVPSVAYPSCQRLEFTDISAWIDSPVRIEVTSRHQAPRTTDSDSQARATEASSGHICREPPPQAQASHAPVSDTR